MFVIGISGGIGCGKSSAAQYFSEKKVPVFDADRLSFEVTQKGGGALEEVIALFGKEVINEEGAMDRVKVSEIVFNDKKRLDKLSAIIHRHVLEDIHQGIKKLEKQKTKLCVLDVPIPVKEGFLDHCDYVLVIWTDDAIRMERLKERGMDEREARRRMAMQMTKEEYAGLANEVIENNKDKAALYAALDEFCERELLSRGIRIQE